MLILRLILSVVLLVTLARAIPFPHNVDSPDDNEIPQASDEDVPRLPTNVKPSHYVIKLVPNIVVDNFIFTGESKITITISGDKTTTVTLHSKDLVFDEKYTTLVDSTDATKIFKPSAHTLEPKADFLVLDFSKTPLDAGEYFLNIKYAGILSDDLNGFYRSSYKNYKGEEIWLATTQFEPTHARRAFPCFDEPALKATFDISIKHLDKYKAVSNMPAISRTRDEESLLLWWTKFEVTPIMSTYLIAFVISDFEYLTTADGKFSVWSRYNAIHNGHYAQDLGQKELKFLEDYTGIKYNLPKLDNFAIPQFRAGAMENWGLVTYRESGLLYEENITTTESKQGIATVISHEFAHQWFGNLVGPAWWDYTWLNEGFANFFQYIITEQAETNWRLIDQFVIKNLQDAAFTADGIENQHPMNAKVNSPKEISANFDSITYSKAGCVIRMISHVLTEKVFKAGLTAYLKDNSYKAATSDDLFKAFITAAKDFPKTVPLKEVLDSWANQRGFPVITVTRDHKAGTASISQIRYISKNSTADKPKEAWWIPINFATQDKPNFEDTTSPYWFSAKEKKLDLLGFKENQWVIFNKQQTGYYRVNYDATNWKLIATYLRSKDYANIHVLNRAQLLDDSFNFAQTGEISDYYTFLDVSTYLQNETDYVPWHTAFRAFSSLNKALANTEKYDLFKLYILKLIENLEKSVGFVETEEDDHVTKFNRINAINWACSVGSANCRSATHEQLLKHLDGSKKISADLRSVVLCAGIRTANATTWQKTFEFYENSKINTERSAVLNALGCSADTDILKSYLAKTLDSESKIPLQDVLKAVYSGNQAGLNVVFDFINENFKELYALEANKEVITTVLNDIVNKLTTTAQLEKLNKAITDNKDFAQIVKTESLETANKNIKWVATHESIITVFLLTQNLIEERTTEEPNSSPNMSLPSLPISLFLAAITFFIARFH